MTDICIWIIAAIMLLGTLALVVGGFYWYKHFIKGRGRLYDLVTMEDVTRYASTYLKSHPDTEQLAVRGFRAEEFRAKVPKLFLPKTVKYVVVFFLTDGQDVLEHVNVMCAKELEKALHPDYVDKAMIFTK